MAALPLLLLDAPSAGANENKRKYRAGSLTRQLYSWQSFSSPLDRIDWPWLASTQMLSGKRAKIQWKTVALDLL